MTEIDLVSQNLRYLLDKVEQAAVQLSYDLPARRYYTVGGAVYDCEQVVVSAMSSDPGIVSADPGAINLLGNCDASWNGVFEATIVLCAAEGITTRTGSYTPPPVEDVMLDADRMSGAYAVLRTAVENIATDQTLGAPSGRITFGQPQGGLIACSLNINTNVWYYTEAP